MVAGPAIGAGAVDHSGADRVELNIAITGEQIILLLDQACLVAPVPQRAAAAIAMVDVEHVIPPEVIAATGRWRLRSGVNRRIGVCGASRALLAGRARQQHINSI